MSNRFRIYSGRLYQIDRVLSRACDNRDIPRLLNDYPLLLRPTVISLLYSPLLIVAQTG